MTHKEFLDTNWHRGNVVKLENGKEYLVKGVKGRGNYLLLYSLEYDARFVADYRIVDCRTSDYEEPEEVYLEMKRQKQAQAEARRLAEHEAAMKAKEERKQRHLEAQEKAHQEALAKKAAKKKAQLQSKPKTVEKPVKPAAPVKPKAAEAPKVVESVSKPAEPATEAPKKRVRQRIRISSATPVREKVEIFKKK